jgi:allantoin racemase
MRIMVINPNSSTPMTDHIRTELERVKRQDTEVTVITNEGAPPAIQSAMDEAASVPPLLERVLRANQEAFDAVILACFSDPGLHAAREASQILVLGIEETTLHIAAMMGHRFTILTPLASRIPSKVENVKRCGLSEYLSSVRALGMTVAETEADPDRTKAQILNVSRNAMNQDGAEVIVLGCAGMVGYARDVETELGLVVLDPTTVTLKVCEGLVDAGVRHCRNGLYASPCGSNEP